MLGLVPEAKDTAERESKDEQEESEPMKPAAWRIFRNNRWNYSDAKNNRADERIAWQPLYTDIDMKAEFERGREHERALQVKAKEESK